MRASFSTGRVHGRAIGVKREFALKGRPSLQIEGTNGIPTPRFGAWVLLLPTLVLSALAAFDRTGSAAV
jgi:hypothetical protein